MLQLEAQLADRNVTIELSEEAAKWLIEHGYDEQMGARPMARVIQEHIKKPLADEVLFGKLKGGGHVRVIVKQGRERRRQARLRVSGGAGHAASPEKLPEPRKSRAKRRARRASPSRRDRRAAARRRPAAARCRRCRW